MADARLDERWSHTASLMALIANIHRPRSGRRFTPDDFNPRPRNGAPSARRQRAAAIPVVGITALRDVFIGQGRAAKGGPREAHI